MNPTRIRKLARERDVAIEVEIFDIFRRVESIDFFKGNRLETLFSFRMFLKPRLESLLFPALAIYFSG